jgi:hypothetical protein
LIECESKRREAERKGDLNWNHTEDCLKLKLHTDRKEQSRGDLEEDLAKPKKRISISQADALYKRLLVHKERTKAKLEEIRKNRAIREW